MGEEYDPTNLGLAAGESGGKQGFMTVALSDRAAKDYSNAIASIERSSKIGAFNDILSIVDRLAAIKDNPMLNVALSWLELLSTMINAEFADSAQKLAETLFSEETVSRMERMADAAGVLNDTMGAGIDTFNAWDRQMTALDSKASLYMGALEHLEYIIDKNINQTNVFSGALGHLTYIIKNGESAVKGLENALNDLTDEVKDAIDKVIDFWEEVNG